MESFILGEPTVENVLVGGRLIEMTTFALETTYAYMESSFTTENYLPCDIHTDRISLTAYMPGELCRVHGCHICPGPACQPPATVKVKDCHFCECYEPDKPSKGCHCECHE